MTSQEVEQREKISVKKEAQLESGRQLEKLKVGNNLKNQRQETNREIKSMATAKLSLKG